MQLAYNRKPEQNLFFYPLELNTEDRGGPRAECRGGRTTLIVSYEMCCILQQI